VFAAVDFDVGRSEVACVPTQTIEGEPIKGQDRGGTKLERAFRLKPILNLLDRVIELPQAIFGFLVGFLLRVGNQLDFERFAVPIVQAHLRLLPLQGLGFSVHCFSGDPWVLDVGVPVRKTSALFFFLFSCNCKSLGSF
jgi:hypothetical protein